MQKNPLRSRVIKTAPVEWRSFQFLQQDQFKTIGKEERQRLKTSILTNNFTQPFYVWQDPADGVVYCLDGWHRTTVMLEMLYYDAVEIPDLLPATFIECQDKREAARLVLIYSSMYAKVSEAGFLDFIENYELNPIELMGEVNLPEFEGFKTADRFIELQDDGFDEQQEVAKIFLPLSGRGDIFRLNDHVVICADSRDLSSFAELLGDRRAQIIYCDPPYNISYNYESGLNPGKRKYTTQSFSDSLKDDEYLQLITLTLAEALTYSKKDAHVFYWCDEKYIWLIQEAFNKWGIDNRRVCFWIKERLNPVPQIAFNKVIEPCVYGTFGNPTLNPDFTNLTEVWNSDIDKSHSIDDLMSMVQTWMVPRDDISSYEHPTTKPIKLHEKPLKRCSMQGDVVMDLFGGSGSTLISCQQLNRKATLVEQDPVFVDLIIRRYLAYCDKNGIEVSFAHCNGSLHLNSFINDPITTTV